MALRVAGIGFAAVIVLTIGIFAYFRNEVDPDKLSARSLNQTTKFYDRTGEHLLYEVYGDQNRTLVEYNDISENMKNATVAIEDKDFYKHQGFSVSGIIRAAVNNIFNQGTTQGGSTITQQFVKNSLLSSERTLIRKIKELILSIQIEARYDKNEILSFYLNEIPYGSQEYGVEAAAQSFFRKPASKLTIAESAMLAALPQAPTYFSPYGDHTDELKARQERIIDLMHQQGYITAEQAEKTKQTDVIGRVTPIDERSLYRNIFAPHFVLEVQRQLEDEFGPALVQNGGLKIITTLDYDKQKSAVGKAKKVPKLGDAHLNAARAALRGPDPVEALRLMEEYRDIVFSTRELLLAEVPNPEKKSGGFKHMEMHVRRVLHQMEDIIADAPLTLRESFEEVRADLEKIDKLLIRDLFPRQPGLAPGSNR